MSRTILPGLTFFLNDEAAAAAAGVPATSADVIYTNGRSRSMRPSQCTAGNAVYICMAESSGTPGRLNWNPGRTSAAASAAFDVASFLSLTGSARRSISAACRARRSSSSLRMSRTSCRRASFCPGTFLLSRFLDTQLRNQMRKTVPVVSYTSTCIDAIVAFSSRHSRLWRWRMRPRCVTSRSIRCTSISACSGLSYGVRRPFRPFRLRIG